MEKITIPAKGFIRMHSPYADEQSPDKVRFFVRIGDVPAAIENWMATNPREQNLRSPVSKAIAASIRDDTKDFHLKNRGVLLSAQSAEFTQEPAAAPGEGIVTLTFTRPELHGNVDGGHTLRLILAAQDEGQMPEQYVEFEVMVGLKDLLPIAEARNTSVALDMRTMEEMKGSFDVLKSILADVEIQGDRFFDRVELKMNQQLEERNHIDIRMLISVLLMFNQELFPLPKVASLDENPPIQMYGGKEAALAKYLSLGAGDPEKRNEAIRKMAPIMADILKLWDIIERELPEVNAKKYSRLPFVERAKAPVGLFSNAPLKYIVPQSIMFPFVAAFRALVQVDEDGVYGWLESPFDAWVDSKQQMTSSLFDTLKTYKNNPTTPGRKSMYWYQYYQIILLYRYQRQMA